MVRFALLACALAVIALLLPNLQGRAPVDAPGPATVADYQGRARVTDGDTFRLGDTRIRVFGIDAPEAEEFCGTWACGRAATDWLRDRLAGQTVACIERDIDRYGRVVARCTVGGQDIAEQMVAVGLARAYRRWSPDYIDEERAAQRAGLGIWAAEVQSTSATAPTTAKRNCAIKGNISDSGKYYHLPGGRDYNRTQINESRGERWFCSESEAQAAGWRRAGG